MAKRPLTRPEPRKALDSDRIRQRYERLLRSVDALLSLHRPDQVLQEVTDVARDVVGARYAALGVLDADGASLSAFVTSGLTESERSRIGDPPHGHGLLGLVIREARPIRTAKIHQHPHAHGFPPGHPQMESFLGVPIATGRGVFGNLYLTDKVGAKEFTAEDEEIAVMLAAQAAVAVENARLFEESERLLAEVRTMQRERELFFAMMNHELRNALTGVYGWAERLVRGKGGDVAQAAQEVYEGAERTVNLLNNVLDMTRLDAGKIRPVWRVVDVRNEVQRALVGVEPAAEARRIRLQSDYPAKAAPITTDPVRLQQILTNLLTNAIRHSPEGETVTLAVTATAQQFLFTVSDRGPGIPAELRERIFEPFERFVPETGMGAGLGLAISRRLAEVLGGSLKLSSGEEGGARFVLELPKDAPG
ncbi:MAG TPA: GAF domain-containing sensor histidine kinase [Gemmatimonadales bacterium]|nr:GAF domain-containing sensor histidine kinase [Gemmatimonadales bacterium]